MMAVCKVRHNCKPLPHLETLEIRLLLAASVLDVVPSANSLSSFNGGIASGFMDVAPPAADTSSTAGTNPLAGASSAGEEEFVGPLVGWENVKTYGAVGDGVADDTAAFQLALTNLGTNGHSKVLYIPAGTYMITSTLSAYNNISSYTKYGVSILGADPATTIIKWYGPTDGTMLDFDTLTKARFGRFTLAGNNTAGVGCWQWTSNGTSNASTLEDTVFKNMKIGLKFCDHPGEVVNTPAYICDFAVDRCQFLYCSVAGINQNNFNSLNIPIEYCLFDHCGIAVTDSLSGTRWASVTGVDPQWLAVDLGANYSVQSVYLAWNGSSYATAFQIQTSLNNSTWTTASSTTAGGGGEQNISFTAKTARYVRMYGTAQNGTGGYSLLDFEVFSGSVVNLALNKTTTASSVLSGSYPASYATDLLGNFGGHGNIQVYYSVFRNSTTADAQITPDAFCTFRGNYSIGSGTFVVSGWNGTNGFALTLQDNVILDPVHTPISIESSGPVTLIDNIIRYTGSPVVLVGTGSVNDIISVGNTYCVAKPFSTNGGRIYSLDDLLSGSASSITNSEPSLPAPPPNLNRHIFELSASATGAEIQAAITSAYRLYNGQHAVVHIPTGTHTVSLTIVVRANSDVQLVGDGEAMTTLQWSSAPATRGSMLLQLPGPSQAVVRDLQIDANGNCDSGLVINVADVAGDRVYLSQISSYNQSPNVPANLWAGILIYGQVNSMVDINTLELNYGGGQANTGAGALSVYGNSAGNPFTGGRTIVTGTNIGGYAAYNNAHLVVDDSWYEAHPLENPQFMNLTSTGTVTLQGNIVAPCTGPVTNGTPGIDVNGFQGYLSLLGINYMHNSSGWPNIWSPLYPTTTVVEANTGANANVLSLGSIGDSGTNGQWFFNNSTTANVGFLGNDWKNSTGASVAQVANSGNTTAAFIRSMLNQARTEKRVPWPLMATPVGTTDVRVTRVFTMNAISANIVVYSDASGLPGLTPALTAPEVATPAAASLTTVTGTSTNLSALGADPVTGAESSLTYTWAATGTPPAAVTFGANGSNAAKNCTATFAKAGNYTLRVTITATNGLATTSTVNVTVNQTPTAITLNSSPATLSNGQSTTLSVNAVKDQFNSLIAPATTVTWSLLNTPLGTLTPAGVYTAPASGPGSDTLQAQVGTATTSTTIATILSVIAGTGGNDTIRLVRHAPGSGQLDVFINNVTGTPTYTATLAAMGPLQINDSAGNNAFVLDFSNGSPLSSGPITLTGNSSGTNTLQVIGATTADSFGLTASSLTHGTDPVLNFSNIKTVSLGTGIYTAGTDLNGLNITVNAGATVNLNALNHLGAVVLNSGGQLQLPVSGSLGLSVDSLTIAGGVLDLANNSLVVHNGVQGTVTGYLKNGYNLGSWTGSSGILSSYAALPAHGSQGFGMLSGAVFKALHPGQQVLGQIPSDMEVVVQYAYLGDATLKGSVTADDFTQLDASFLRQRSNPTWFQGDYNYDGVADAGDFMVIYAAYTSQGTHPLAAGAVVEAPVMLAATVTLAPAASVLTVQSAQVATKPTGLLVSRQLLNAPPSATTLNGDKPLESASQRLRRTVIQLAKLRR